MPKRKEADRVEIISEYRPYKKKVYKNFILWNSIPFELRKIPLNEAENWGINIKNSLLKELLSISTQREFAEKYNVSEDVLCIWNRRKDFKEELNKIIKEGILKYKKDVDFSLTKKAIKYGDAPRVKLWKQLFEGWVEKEKREISGDLSLLIDEMNESKEDLVKKT